MTREELKKHYAQADVLLRHLNDYDAFEKVLPSKIFEYATTGKLILAGVSGYAAEFTTEYVENAVVFLHAMRKGWWPNCKPLIFSLEIEWNSQSALHEPKLWKIWRKTSFIFASALEAALVYLQLNVQLEDDYVTDFSWHV